jgi:hypothetical protein
MGAMLVVTTWTLNPKITVLRGIYNMIIASLVVTSWTLNLNITTQHLQHDGGLVGSYHVDIIHEDYYAATSCRQSQLGISLPWYHQKAMLEATATWTLSYDAAFNL